MPISPRNIAVQYPDFIDAIKLCIKEGANCKLARSDWKSAFRHICISRKDWNLLCMRARSPIDGQIYYFYDKCLSFGASVSCALFQRFSNSIKHVVEFRTGKELVNYLDDYLFIAAIAALGNSQVRVFLEICELIKFPVAMEKTYWATSYLTFLGFLIDSVNQRVMIPKEKILKAQQLIASILENKNKKVTVKNLQRVCGFLNFIGRCVVPGRAFTRRLYYYFSNNKLKPHHHLRVTPEMRADLMVWKTFIEHSSIFCRPFMDFSRYILADEIDMYSDASKNPSLGFAATCGTSWLFRQWNGDFIMEHDPSINYLELYALTAGVLTWIHRFQNRRIILFCDNLSVVAMINSNTSRCKNCMTLIRLIVLHSLVFNVRVFARWVSSRNNFFADALSRLKITSFKWKAEGKFEKRPTRVPELIWPMEKIWIKN